MQLLEYVLETRTRRIVAALVILVFMVVTTAVLPPGRFDHHTFVSIPSGTPVSVAAALLEDAHVVRSKTAFTLLIRLFGGDRGVSSGTYLFERPVSVFEAAYRVNTGDTGTPLIRVTIPEGSTAKDIASILGASLVGFDTERFLILATPYEGRLFPETYLFTEGIPPEAVIETMTAEFSKRILEIQDDIDAFDTSLDEVIVMASILEKEARLYDTKQRVAGILWKRIDIGMPLQVDAVFGYILGVETFSPTFEQLEIDSPYNTYKNRGLPPGPISNPGLESLRAALNPIKTPYLYYLTGSDGTMHYAETFDEHVENRKYLR